MAPETNPRESSGDQGSLSPRRPGEGAANETVGPSTRLVPPEAERAIGLEFYLTSTAAVQGMIKSEPQDFRVKEVSRYPWPDEQGSFVVVRVESENWEQHELSSRLARELGLPPQAVRWSGTKDRRAIADRLFSYRGTRLPENVTVPRVRILDAYRSREPLMLGHHYGNAFDVRVRLSGAPEEVESLDATHRELRSVGWFPNWFGPQRFGEVRPVTHLVGGELVRNNPDGAVECYLCDVPPGSAPSPDGDRARSEYARHHDPRRALSEFPEWFRFERTLLDHLARGQTAARAIRALSKGLRDLFVHSYQALLFNRYLSERWRRGLPLDRPVEGDVVLRVARDGGVARTEPVLVDTNNVQEVSRLVEKGGARVAGPLVGYETPQLRGPGGEIVESILRSEAVERAAFRLPEQPEIASEGSYRALTVPLPPLALVSENGTDSRGAGSVRLTFALPPGSYATILLREFLKTGAQEAAKVREN